MRFFFNLYCIVIQLIVIFLAKNLAKHLAVNKKPTTFAPAIERDAVVKGLEGLKILKKISDNLDRKNKSHYLCSHVSRPGAVKRKRSLKELHINK